MSKWTGEILNIKFYRKSRQYLAFNTNLYLPMYVMLLIVKTDLLQNPLMALYITHVAKLLEKMVYFVLLISISINFNLCCLVKVNFPLN